MSDYTNIIQEINTNIPDNTDQAITALKVRTTLIDMLDAVDDNMTEAIGEISVPTKTSDLTNDSGFITATSLEPYVTKTELSNASYVTELQLQQAGYVTQNELNSMSYVTESQLQQAGYATTSFVDDAIADAFEDSDFMTETDVNNLLSTASYVTSEQLSAIGYITNQDLNETLSSATYVSQSDISNMGYVTGSEIAASGYVTQSALNSMSYVTESQLNNASYVNTTQLNEAISGITVPTKTSDLTNDSGFITASDLSGYATETYVADYVSQHTPTPDLSAYVTKTELSSMGYITMGDVSACGYITTSDVSQMGYITASDLPDMSSYATLTYLETYYATLQNVSDTADAMQQVLIDANVLVADPETGDWTTQVMASETYVADYVSEHAPSPDMSAYVTKTELSNAGYITTSDVSQMGYVTSSDLSNMGYITSIPAEYVTQSELSSMSYATTSQLPNMSDYVSKTELSNASYVTQSALSNMGYLTAIPSEYVTESELSAKSYATTTQLATKQDTLVSGTNIKTVNNNSLLGSGNITISSSGNLIAEVTQAEYEAMQQAGTLDPNTIYVITDAPATDLSYYALKTELTESLIPNTTNTYTLGDSSHIYNSTYTSRLYLGSNITIAPESNAQTGSDITININGSQKFYLNSNRFTPNGSSNNKVIDLGTSDRMWRYTYSANFIENGTDISDKYATKSEIANAGYVSQTQLNNAGYLTSIPNTYATYAAISNMGYLTSANFIYDSSTYTLTISI